MNVKFRNMRCGRIKNATRFVSTGTKFEGKVIETVPETLHRHLFGKGRSAVPSKKPIDIHLPKLTASNIRDHLNNIAAGQSKPYRDLLDRMADIDWSSFKLPKRWNFESGWTRYGFDGKIYKVEHPLEEAFLFDVEVCVPEGLLPTLAVAISQEAWYGWVSKRLAEDAPIPLYATQDHLIPLGRGDSPRIAIGHNVGYDRVRSREPYDKQPSGLRFMDTMSMSLPMIGVADHQVSAYEMYDNEDCFTPPMPGEKDTWERKKKRDEMIWHPEWYTRTSRNSLAAVHAFLYGRDIVEKDSRNIFVKGDIPAIREEFQTLMEYCAMDNVYTGYIFTRLWKMFNERYPSPATLCGMLQMGNAYLPVNKNWRTFYENNVSTSDELKGDAANSVILVARTIRDSGKDLRSDLWMWPFAGADPNEKPVTRRIKEPDRFPWWYYKIFKDKKHSEDDDYVYTGDDVVLKSVIVPALFGMVYGPYPMCFTREHKWGFLVPKINAKMEDGNPLDLKLLADEVLRNKENYPDNDIPFLVKPVCEVFGASFCKIPHPNGTGENVGHVFSKKLFNSIQNGLIRATRFENEFSMLIESLKTTRFWTNYEKRFDNELAVWYDSDNAEPNDGAIAPAIIPAGTVSRRSVHKLWVTLTNSSDDTIIGTSIKGMVQAPEGYRLVGADVDSQEQWLAGLYGDASVARGIPYEERMPGITAFSNMMLAGTKADKSDLHSVVAKQLGISRDTAKMLNYARLYGSGENHAAKALEQNGMDPEAAKKVANDLFRLTKGAPFKWRFLRQQYVPLLEEYVKTQGDRECPVLVIDGKRLIPDYIGTHGKFTVDFEEWILSKLKTALPSVNENIVPLLYEQYTETHNYFYGGYESATFNFLEYTARQDDIRTPVLQCKIGNALCLPPGTTGRDVFISRFKRSVMNWVVQSSAADFLHLLLISMEWLCKTYDIPARFVVSIHDEVRYLCKEEDAPRVGLALMLSNLYVRSFISMQVGIEQLPESVAFFSQVDCDTVLRKETNHRVVNPDGTDVPDGVAWTLEDLIKITGGRLDRSPIDSESSKTAVRRSA